MRPSATVLSFLDELDKIAAVRGPVKQFRRALAAFQSAKTSIPRGDPHSIPRGGWAHHGTEDLSGIVSSGKIHPSVEGEHGQHGGGVYWWKGFPREHYLKGLQDEGIVTDIKSLPNKLAPQRNLSGGHLNLHAQRTGPGPYELRPKDTAVVDMASRKGKSLKNLLADAAEKRLRVTDTGIFHRARQQVVKNTSAEPLQSPSKRELLKLYRRRRAGQLT